MFLRLWQKYFGVPNVELDPRYVTIWVDGREVEVLGGPCHGRAIYQAAGRDALRGYILVGPDARFVAECTPVDLKGGEVFIPVPYGF